VSDKEKVVVLPPGPEANPYVVKGQCDFCGVRPAVAWWGEGMMDLVHGMCAKICDRCSTEKQLAHAREMAAKVAELEAALKKIDDEEAKARG